MHGRRPGMGWVWRLVVSRTAVGLLCRWAIVVVALMVSAAMGIHLRVFLLVAWLCAPVSFPAQRARCRSIQIARSDSSTETIPASTTRLPGGRTPQVVVVRRLPLPERRTSSGAFVVFCLFPVSAPVPTFFTTSRPILSVHRRSTGIASLVASPGRTAVKCGFFVLSPVWSFLWRHPPIIYLPGVSTVARFERSRSRTALGMW